MINKDREEELSDAQRVQLRTDLSDSNYSALRGDGSGKLLSGGLCIYKAYQRNADAHIATTQQQLQAAQAEGRPETQFNNSKVN